MNDVRVLELGGGVAPAFATMLLAAMGADVVRVTAPPRAAAPPGASAPSGAAATAAAPVAPAADGRFASAYLHRRKRSVTLAHADPRAQPLLRRAIDWADLVIEGLGPGGLARHGAAFAALHAARPGLVVVSISPFGQHGPRAHWLANDFVLQAMGGIVAASGFADGQPTKLPDWQASYSAGVQAATAGLVAVFAVRAGAGTGVQVDVSIQEAMSTHWTREISEFVYEGIGRRRPDRGASTRYPIAAEVADGRIAMPARNTPWADVAAFLGIPEFAGGEWADPAQRAARWAEVEPALAAALKRYTRAEWHARGAALGYIWGPLHDLQEVLESPQLAARQFFGQTHVDGQALPCPRLPFGFAAVPPRPDEAPAAGADNAAFFGELGVGAAELAQLAGSGLV
jgi:crotonobetainyl-CoA:carnitine CoA-transferase CaiB-like acyl-CoA transferase